MALNNFVSLAQVIADWRDDNNDQSDRFRIMANRWVSRLLPKLLSRNMLEPKICVLQFSGYNLILPPDAMLIGGMLWGDYGTSSWEYFDSYNKYFPVADVKSYNIFIGQLNNSGGASGVYKSYDYTISDGVMQFNQNHDQEYVTVLYYGYKTDDCGNLMVPEYLIEVIIAWWDFRRTKQRYYAEPNAQLRMLYNEAMRMYDVRFKEAIGRNTQLTDQERISVVNQINSPYTGHNVMWPIYPEYARLFAAIR